MKRGIYRVAVGMTLLISNAMAFPIESAGRNDQQPVEITANSLSVEQERQIATFSGNVEAVQGDVVLRADEMVVHYREKRMGDENSVSKIETNGNVFLATPKESAQGKNGLYEVDQQTITLTGDVIVSSGDNVIKGTQLVYNLQSGESRIVSEGKPGNVTSPGRVRGVFVPQDSE